MKYKERIARWNKIFFSQYDIVSMMNLKDFDFRDFIISVDSNSISYKSLNQWFFNEQMLSKEDISEFMFFYYQYNFYPKRGHSWYNREGSKFSRFSVLKKKLEDAISHSRQ